MKRILVIGSRGSDLALRQAEHVIHLLEKRGISCRLKIIRTKGDEVALGFDKMEGKGFFTKEIEEALLRKEIDMAVHSHKDLPTESPAGLCIAAVPEREDPSELLLIRPEAVDEKEKFSLKQGAVVGTSSSRRKAQLLAWRPDVIVKDLRGNVPSRVKKLRDNDYDAILIANAGFSRLGLEPEGLHAGLLDPNEFMPAPAQGALALQVREEDTELIKALEPLDDPEASRLTGVERKVMNLFNGGCQLPLGVICTKEEHDGEDQYFVRASLAPSWNKMPRYTILRSKKTEGLAEKTAALLSAVYQSGTRILLTRNQKRNDFFVRCLKGNGFRVTARALISFSEIPIRNYEKCDWVFFSSKHAVRYFFGQNPDAEGMKIGAVGKATAEEIRKFGRRAEFIGNPDDTRLTGKKFAALAGNRKVLFPQARDSMRTIQMQMPRKENVKDLVVYETVKDAGDWLQSEEYDVMAFTSPSNADAFFEKHNVQPEQKVIAMGDATAAALKKYGVKAHGQPPSFDDMGLVQAVFGVVVLK